MPPNYRRLRVLRCDDEATQYLIHSFSRPGAMYVVSHIHNTDDFGCKDYDTNEPCRGAKYSYPCEHIKAIRTALGERPEKCKDGVASD